MMEYPIDDLISVAGPKEHDSILEFCQTNSVAIQFRRNSKDQVLLHYAAGYGKVKVVKDLIAAGAEVDVQDEDGISPLHNACCHGHPFTSRVLIEAGANVNLTDSSGWTPLRFALARKDNIEKISPLYREVVELLLDFGADPYVKSFRSKSSCFALIRDPDDKLDVKVRYLVNRLKSCQIEDADARELIIDEHLSVVDFFELVKRGDEILDTIKALTTQRLLRSQLDSCDDITPLHRAAGYNHLETAKYLISKGARVSATDCDGRIPLHNAAQYGHVDMIELLTIEGSDVNTRDNKGYSPLHEAALNNCTFLACLKLIELGANVNLRSDADELAHDLARYDDIGEVLAPIPVSTSDQPIYFEAVPALPEMPSDNEPRDELMLDSKKSTFDSSLFKSKEYSIKKVPLKPDDPRYQLVERRMMDTIRYHNTESGGRFDSYEILGIELLLNKKVWKKYGLMCDKLDCEYGPGSRNEKLLFHGSNFIDKIQLKGFDERYAQRDGMFGAGIYFAKHSSKSNQYTFGFGQGCPEHQDKSCYVCERKMVYAQVALGRSLVSKEAIPECAHAPPGYSSVSGLPESTDNLMYPEYVIYSGDQAYPLYIIRYRIKFSALH